MILTLSKSLKTELYRKAVHLSSLWMPMFICLAGSNWSALVFFLLLTADLIIEYAAYKKTAFWGSLFRRMFIKTLRSKEISKNRFTPSGSVYILLSALICSVCFPAHTAAVSMAVMLVADSAAALCGKLFGRIRYRNGKSFEGTLAFSAAAVAVIWLSSAPVSPVYAVLAALAASAAEFYEKSLKMDDNLTIPLITGFILNFCTL